jgi:hypothetical protein
VPSASCSVIMSPLGLVLKSNGVLATLGLMLLGFVVGYLLSYKLGPLTTRITQAALEAHGEISKAEALALASVNIEKLLGVKSGHSHGDLVATRGGTLLDFQSRVVGLISSSRGVVDLV